MRALVSFAAALAVAGISACSPPSVKAGLESSPASSYEATTTSGKGVSLASLRGEVVLLNAWATWCGPCRVEIPYLEQLHASNSHRSLHVVGVSIDAAEDRQKVLDLASSLHMNYDIWLDPEARVESVLGNSNVPGTVLIDSAGNIRWKHLGAIDETTPGFREALEFLLQASSDG